MVYIILAIVFAAPAAYAVCIAIMLVLAGFEELLCWLFPERETQRIVQLVTNGDLK